MENTIDKQQMDAMKALVDTNMKVSEAKNTLIKLEETETEYLVSRERIAMERIQKVHDNSAELLKQTQTNYVDIQALLASVSSATSFLEGAYTTFKGLLELFEEKNRQWEANCKQWEENHAVVKDQIRVAQAQIESGRKENQERQGKLNIIQRKLDDDVATMKRNIARLAAKQP